MAEFYTQLKKAMKKRNISQTELCEKTGIPKSAMSQYISGAFKPKQKRTYLIANALKVNEAWLMGYEDVPMEKNDPMESNISAILPSENIRMIPVYESVYAGFGAYADNCIVDYIPLYIENDEEAENTMCITVEGNSMYPKIEDGDKIQVLRQDWAEEGQVIVALIDSEDGVVKKLEYDDNSITLVSFNPEYAPRVFEGAERDRIKILGVVRTVIKQL